MEIIDSLIQALQTLLSEDVFQILLSYLILYWSYCIFIGVKNFLWVKTIRDYSIINRSLPYWIFIFAATATSFSGWTFMSHPGLVYRDGFPAAFASFYAITIPLAGLFFLKRQWMLSKRCGFVTPGEMFADYFNSDKLIPLLVFIVAVLFSILYIAVQLRASGFLFHILTDEKLSEEVGIILLSLVLITYVALGGLRAVAYVDTLQMTLKATGIVTIGLIVLHYVGGTEPLLKGIVALTQTDEHFVTKLTAGGYSHFIAIPSAFTSKAEFTGGDWTGMKILTFMIVLMGIQCSPAFSMWAFSNESPRPFAFQQVWASAAIMGFILIIFVTIQGFGTHLLGADYALRESHPEVVKNILGVFLDDDDLTVYYQKEQQEILVPLLIQFIGGLSPWLMGLLSICALAAMQSTAAAYMSTTGTMFSRDLVKRYFKLKMSETGQIWWGRIGVVFTTGLALWIANQSTDTLVFLGALAVSYSLQMMPALIGICWFPFLTRRGIALGLIAGLIVVTFTDEFGVLYLLNFFAYLMGLDNWYWGRHPLTIYSGVWGILFNFLVAGGVSLLLHRSGKDDDREHRDKFHAFLNEYDSRHSIPKKWNIFATIALVMWFIFAVGPGIALSNNKWLGNVPFVWVWQIIGWLLGVCLMYFLAYKMQFSTESRYVEPLREDIYEKRRIEPII